MAYANNQFCWHGVVTTDMEAAKAFYTATIGWSIQETQMGDETATTIVANEISRMHMMLPPMLGVPPHISSYLRVTDVDAGLKLAVASGGTMTMPPMDIAPGRFAGVMSPSGAHFYLYHEADESSAQTPLSDEGSVHWVELHSTDMKADHSWLHASFGLMANKMPMPDGDYFILSADGEQMGGVMKGMAPDVPSHWLVWIKVAGVDAC
ncbi:MAG: putative enzyme related to lactoylglutathione lyase [Bradymonadia bacterium]|jgi:predicted enzyme related to lactoylglutathione lyase